MSLVRTEINTRTILVRQEDLDFANALASAPKGGFATAIGYKPTTNVIIQPVMNINFLSRFSTHKVYERRINFLRGLKFHEVSFDSPKLMALSVKDQKELFDSCVSAKVQSMTKTLNDIVDSNHRIAHEIFYVPVENGVKLHLQTVDGKNGKELVLQDGLPIVSNVMMTILEVGRKVIEPGTYKTVNSGPKVLMDNAIEGAMKKTLQIKTLTFNPSNHDALKIGGEVYNAQALQQAMDVAE